MFKIVSRDEAISSALNDMCVYQVDINGMYVADVRSVRLADLEDNEFTCYILKCEENYYD